MYDTITPEQWIIGLVISLLAFAGLAFGSIAPAFAQTPAPAPAGR